MFKKKHHEAEELEEEYIEEEEDEEEEEERRKKGEPTRFSLLLNKYFHHVDRGSSLHREIGSGIIIFLLSICMLFINMQIISSSILGEFTLDSSLSDFNLEASLTYASMYVGSLIIAFVGSLLMGLVARLPFVQISTMGLGTSMLSLISTSSGLSYYNLLFISFIASLLYVVIVSVPFIKRFILKAIPTGVRKALPVALGLILVVTCLSLSGIIDTNSLALNPASSTINSISYYTFKGFNGIGKIALEAMIASLLALGFIGTFKALKMKGAYLKGFLLGTVLFILINIASTGLNPSTNVADPDSFLNFGRVWVIAGSSKLIETPFADSYLTYAPKAFAEVFSNMGKVFTEGTNFSSYTGNTFVLFVFGILNYLFLGLFDADGTLASASDDLNKDLKEGVAKFELTSKDSYIAMTTNAAMNVVGPLFGAGGVTLSKSSLAGIEDGAKSGIAPVVSSIGYLISMFIMAFPALLATTTYIVGSSNDFNYFAYGNGGFVQLTSSLTFGIADAVMALVGISMMKKIKNIEWKDGLEVVPAIVTIVSSFIFTNLVVGVALGTITYLVMKLCKFKKEEKVKLSVLGQDFVTNIKTFSISEVVFGAMMLITLIIGLCL